MKRLKIKIEPQSRVKEYFDDLLQWENEGGMVESYYPGKIELESPLKPGSQFKVTGGELLVENGVYYFAADIEPVPETLSRVS